MTPDEAGALIQGHVARLAAAHAAALEAACEASLTDGNGWGVLDDADGPRPHPSVPYGQIHHHVGRWTP